MFFLMNELFKIHSFYMFSLEAYLVVIVRAIEFVAAKYKEQIDKKRESLMEHKETE